MLSKKNITRIAIVGPDGSGKTSVSAFLNSALSGSRVIYGGKGRHNILPTTTVCFGIWEFVKRFKIAPLTLLVRFLLYYPAEFFEYLFRFFFNSGSGTVIFDRHPVDRIILPLEYRLSKALKGVPLWLSQWPFLLIVSLWYRLFFPKIDLIVFLLPSAELCFERANGQYREVVNAVHKIEAYKAATDLKLARNPSLSISIDQERQIPDICSIILQRIQGLTENA